jgi:hypothetical protein
MRRILSVTFLVLLGAVDCANEGDEGSESHMGETGMGGADEQGSEAAGPGTSAGSGGPGSLTTTGTSASTTSAATMATAATATMTGGGTYDLPEPPTIMECDVWSQDCPEGEKCAMADSMHTPSSSLPPVDSTVCVPVAANPKQLGEPCEIYENTVGHDDCDISLFCTPNVRDQYTAGTCIAQCTGSSAAPQCPDSMVCLGGRGGTYNACHPRCDPVTQSDCATGACYSFSEGFLCSLEGVGTAGEPCSGNTSCIRGYRCEIAAATTGCAAESCCTAYCDLSAPACTGDQTCVDNVYGKDMAGPGMDHVGLCSAPGGL